MAGSNAPITVLDKAYKCAIDGSIHETLVAAYTHHDTVAARRRADQVRDATYKARNNLPHGADRDPTDPKYIAELADWLVRYGLDFKDTP